ncbi:bifunctional folylpolyglutamate synthase/dihydrofolate synthase [Vagococcus xieshaowenii]|uniref:Dihydrofolate synthase/folylpolyglutamate synthase n=1 Tax=Vagococcus xieshaowenii TaxID=2562451 RepID=A0AAJ5EFP1_9ENTE|nr:folylpolyglutamate synthase/dihydrofolate synthase family protein [Vagococcus xieshaowenii]QCA28057.1 bifunctional folylpolyglutamate synthase/dihydrofolate synthase [Vagococcus xieshaowenii]TFZ42087.1 bifunctional folylpolyglutamate synthase/dihydrofolate synthase [Vagococcus xieshaowenii]
MTYEETLEWIHHRLKFGSRPGLIRVETLLERIGNPHVGLPIVHIGGTNGKGSTVAFLRGLLEAQGLKVGTFTSPFITAFNERMSINQHPISNEMLVALVEQVKPVVEEMDKELEIAGITEFELITVLMFLYFKEQEVDVALVEVGLGGLLDSTNVIVEPLATAITTIGFDHMDILGNSLEAIATQKAGIIKSAAPAIVGQLPEEAQAVMERTAQIKNSPLYVLGKDYTYNELGNNIFEFTYKTHQYVLKQPLMGHHQFHNAAVALMTYLTIASKLEVSVEKEAIQEGFHQVTWPGRMEIMSNNPLIVIDGAHNEPAVRTLVDNIRQDFSNKQVTILFAAINTKDISSMLEMLEEVVEERLHVTTFDYPTAVPMTAYVDKFPISQRHVDWKLAFTQLKKELSPDDVLLVTGSLYFISQVRAYITEDEE